MSDKQGVSGQMERFLPGLGTGRCGKDSGEVVARDTGGFCVANVDKVYIFAWVFRCEIANSMMQMAIRLLAQILLMLARRQFNYGGLMVAPAFPGTLM
jgi:hypothetical protein